MKNVFKQNDELLRFNCPGCGCAHAVQHGSDTGPNWGWNKSLTKPTLTPSVLVSYSGADAGKNGAPPATCHSFIVNGKIEFLGDCTHALAGQTVDLPEWGEL